MAKKYNVETGNLYTKDIPKMSDGYYSGDKPNPNLRAFVEQHINEKPYDPIKDDYDVPAFDKPIETTKATAIYNMHTYWSKKPHDAIRQYIRHYTKPGDLVLDLFCGSGGTAMAAIMEGRKAIGIDISPAATFISAGYCTPIDVDQLHKRFKETIAPLLNEPQLNPYLTTCVRCGRKAEIKYVLLAQCFRCSKCLSSVPLSDCTDGDTENFRGRTRTAKLCPHCGERIRTDKDTRLGHIGIKALLQCISGCKPKGVYVDLRDDSSKQATFIIDNEKKAIKLVEKFPLSPRVFRYGLETHIRKDLSGVNVFKISDLFTPRNHAAIASIARSLDWRASALDRSLMFVLTSMCLQVSRMVRASNTATLAGTYYVPPEAKEVNAFSSYQGKLEMFLNLQHDLQAQIVSKPALLISTQCADKTDILPNSVDYIFTDPPYGDKYQYAELNAVWECLLDADDNYWENEIVVNSARNLDETHWCDALRSAIAECYRVLKPGRWLSLCYHDTSEGTWALVQDIMAEVGFLVEQSENALYIDTGQKSYNQQTADKVNKRDLVINFRKPKPGEVTAAIAITGEEDETTFNEKVCQIIRDYIGAHPGCTKDRIYDEVVSRMVRSGQMEAHDFSELLSQVADEVRVEGEKDQGGRWYLKETELVVADAAETAREDMAAEKIGAFIKEHLKKHPGDEGIHYSDLFESYIYAVKDKPRRQLADFLPDYFYKTDQGTWRLPASEEEDRAKREARVKGLGRRVKHYIAQLEQGVIIPDHERPNDSTLTEWLRHCKRSGLYEQGKLLYEKGGLNLDNLTEDALVNAEEDYQVCVRMLARAGGIGAENKPKRGRKVLS
ncbi:MAG TPA: DNA methyltransferase [Smithellaceae bacterium]|nr:DNA methyltransferase [Smithellaceae bacterium]